MDDDFLMRVRLQQMAAYRELCQSIRNTGRGNVFFALLMFFLAYISWQNAQPDWTLYAYAALAVAELCAGFYKWIAPSAEGVLIDGLILLMFVALNLGRQGLQFAAGGGPNLISILFGVYMLLAAISRFKNYAALRRLFAERPSREQLAWFDDLIREIRSADPRSDEQALDLPTRPHWKAKLLGSTAFFVATKGESVWIAGSDEFELVRERRDHGTGRRKALLTVQGQRYPEFNITDTTWDNYQKWLGVSPS